MTKGDKTWRRMYAALELFLSEHERYPSKKENSALYTWIAMQRTLRKNNNLPREYTVSLNKIKFIWDKQEASWLENYRKLVLFRKKNPGRWPSQRSRILLEKSLSIWMLYNRREIKARSIPMHRLELLKKVHFPVYPYDEKWMDKFNQVQKFIQSQKAFPRHNGATVHERKLHSWLRSQAIKRRFKVIDAHKRKLLNEMNIKEFADILRDRELALS